MSNSSSQGVSDSPATCSLTLGPHCRLLGPSHQERCRMRLEQLNQLGLFDCDSIPAFDEVTQQVADLLRVPICVVTIVDQAMEYVKAAYGLSHLGLGNSLAHLRQLPLTEGLGTYVIDSEQPFWVADTGENPVIATSKLAYTYGVGAYGAVPLMASGGQCIGTLAVMDRQPRNFTPQEIGYLAMAARWGMSEYERCSYPPRVRAALASPEPLEQADLLPERQSLIDAVRLHLIGNLIQDLRSPLTAVLGMTSMLGQEIYGPLTKKQREYVDIVHHSSRALMERVEDIVELGLFESEHRLLEVAPVDLEMLSQQVVNTLTQLATQRSQTLSISIEPGERVWLLDKTVVKQILYHVIFSVMQMAGENSTIRVHACRRGKALQLATWLSNPWLGDGLPQAVVRLCHALALQPRVNNGASMRNLSIPWEDPTAEQSPVSLQPEDISRELLGLLLSQQLAECHGGHVQLQGSLDAGYRFVVVIPAEHTAIASADAVVFTQA